MQHPVGYVIRNGRAEMVDFMAMIANPYGLLKFFHTIFSGYVIAAFFVMGISAWHLLKKNRQDFFKRSFRIAATFGLASSILVFIVGDFHAAEVAKTQPSKFAAMEAVWETQKSASYHFMLVPDVAHERNSVEAVSVPKLLSFLAFHDGNAEIKGLKEFPLSDRPPVLPTFAGFRGMAGLGMLFMLLTLVAFILSRRDHIDSYRLFLRIMLLSLPLPYIAAQLGWVLAEVGRQPWIVYGMLRTSDGVSKSISVPQVLTSLTGFTVLYGFLAVVDIYLLMKFARKGPDDDLSSIIRTARQEV
jgi:cytochrome d ubiquinol oxidase subunit I